MPEVSSAARRVRRGLTSPSKSSEDVSWTPRRLRGRIVGLEHGRTTLWMRESDGREEQAERCEGGRDGVEGRRGTWRAGREAS